MNMLPSSNHPQNVRAEIVQNAPREMSIGMVLQSIWRHRFFMLVWLVLVVGLSSLVIFNLQASYRSTALVALDTRQIRFTRMLVDDLVRNGVVDPGRLYEDPYLALGGVDAVYPQDAADAVVAVLADVRARAEVEAGKVA